MKKHLFLSFLFFLICFSCEESMGEKEFGELKTVDYVDLERFMGCLLYTSPSPRDVEESRMPSSA